MKNHAGSLNPFPGLRPFRQDEDYLFFGREEQTMELLQRLGNHRFVAVVGTSGSGKSSLVRCGLLSELLGGKLLRAGAAWEVAVTHPGGNPLALLTESLLEADLYDREEEHARENLLATLSRSQFGLVEAVKQARLGNGTNFLLVVDQFEEIFRFHEAGQTQQEAANEYVSLLLEAAAQSEVPIYIVLTMRSDFIGDCGQFEGLAEMVNRGEFLIPRMTREQYKRVIEAPIKVAGGQIAPRLLQRLLNDLGQQADQLPCLQHALMRTWAERGDAEAIDLDDYQRVGKMSQALSLHADEIYDSLADDRQRELCAGTFQALTVQESESRGIRRPQRLGSLCRILDVSAEQLIPIIDAYRHSGVTFLMPSPEVELTDATIIDISHESLMRVWIRLRRWVDDEAQAVGIYRRLSESAALYEQGKAGLYRDPELGIALAWQADKRPNVAWAERYAPGFAAAIAFLEHSQQAHLAEERAHEDARQRELDQARKLAEAERQRAELEQRAARRLRGLAAAMAVVAVFAVGASLVAVNFWMASDAAKRTAQLSEQSAQRSAQSAINSAADAQREAQRATSQETIAKAARAESEENLNRARTAIDEFLVQVSDSQLLSTPGLQPLRADLLGSASKFYEEFLTKNPDDPQLQAGLADAFYRVGFVNSDLGRHDQALVAIEKALELQQEVHRANPTDAALRHRLAKVWYECSRTRMEKGDYPGSDEAAKNAARLWDALSREEPENIDYKKSLARACNLLGNAGSQLGQPERAFLAYQRSMQIRLDLLEQHPQDVELVHGLGESFNNIGLTIADPDQQVQLSERSIEYAAAAHRLRPQNVEYAMDLVISHYVLAGRLISLNRKPQALDTFRDGVLHSLQFVRANPAVPSVRERLRYLLQYLRSITFDAPQADQYAAIFRNVRNTFAELPRQTADDHLAFAEVQSDCAQQLVRARRTFQKGALTPQDSADIASWHAGSLASLREAIALGYKDAQRLKQDSLLASVRTLPAFTELVSQLEAAGQTSQAVAATGPSSKSDVAAADARTQIARDRAAGYLAFGLGETRFHQTGRADKSLAQSVELRQSLVDAAPESMQLLADLSEVRAAQARLYWTSGQLANARDVYVQSIARLEHAIHDRPGNSALSDSLPDAHVLIASKSLAATERDYADFLAEAGLWDEAAPQYAKAHKNSLRHRVILRKVESTPSLAGEQPYEEILAPLLDLLEASDQSYSDACQQRLAKYRTTANNEQAARLVRLCAIVPNAVPDLAPLLALTEKAQYAWFTYARGLALYRAGRYEEAIRVIEAAQQTKATSGMGVEDFVVAMAYFQSGRAEQARTIVSAANAKTPRSMGDWTHSPHNMFDVDWLVLRREANQLIHGSPHDPDDRRRRSQAYAQLGEFDKADAELSALLAEHPDDLRARWTHAQVLWQLGRKEQAADVLDQARKLLQETGNASAGDVELWRVAVETYRLLDRREEASAALRRAVAAQTLRVIRASSQLTDRWLLLKLNGELVESLQTAGREADAASAREELELLFAVFGLPPAFRTVDDVFADTGPRLSAPGEALAAIDRLLASHRESAADNDPVRRHLQGRLHQRRAELLRNEVRDESEVVAELSAARELFESVLVEFPQDETCAGALASLLLEIPPSNWTVLQPTEMKSEGGAILTRLGDHSILASGQNPPGDQYSISAAVPANAAVQSIRLEALAHESLVDRGPGRGRLGIFAMMNWDVTAAHPTGSTPQVLRFDQIWTDHQYSNYAATSQGGWNISGWNSPGWKSGKDHAAVFSLPVPVSLEAGTKLNFQMQFNRTASWTDQNLGRFRLSTSADMTAARAEMQRFAAMKLTDPWAKLGAAYALSDRPADAARVIARVLEQAPSSAARASLVEHASSNAELLAELSQLRPDDAHIQMGLGKALASKGDWIGAEAAFQKTAKLDAAALPKWIQTGFWKVGLYPSNITTAYPPETAPDPFQPVAAVAGAGQNQPDQLHWQPATPGAEGRIDLGTATGCSYALTRIWSPVEQEVAFQMGDDDAMRLFVNDQFLFHADPNSGASRPKEHEIAVTLQPGWNTVLAKVRNASGPGNVILTLSAEAQDLVAARLGTAKYRATQLAAGGRGSEAVQLLSELIAQHPQSDALYGTRAEVREKLEQWDLAIEDWTKADEVAPDKKVRFGNTNAPYLERRANVYGRLQKWDQQLADWSALVEPERLGDNPWIIAARGETYDRLRDWERARLDHDRAVALAQVQTTALQQVLPRRARHFAQQAQWRAAVDDFASMADSQKSWTVDRDAALVNLLAGDVDAFRRGLQDLDRRVGAKPSADQASWLLRVSTTAPDLITDANRDRLMTAIVSATESTRRRLNASVLYRTGQFAEADQAFRANPGGLEYPYLAAMSAYRAGDAPRAEKVLKDANAALARESQKDPGAAIPKTQLWQYWAVSLALKHEAEELIVGRSLKEANELLAANPLNATALAQRGRVLLSFGDEDAALTDLNQAVELETTDALAYAARGAILLKRRQSAAARSDLEKSLGLEPTEPAAESLADLLLAEAQQTVAWTVLQPKEMRSENGEQFTLETDGSVFVSGPNPDRAIYAIQSVIPLSPVSGLRIETLPDARLPQAGAGRFPENGNFHLAEVTVTIASKTPGGAPMMIEIDGIAADDQQSDAYAPGNIIDGNPKTRWEIHPRHTQPHAVVISFKNPVRSEQGDLVITLDSGITTWGRHGLGRFRLSANGDPRAFEREKSRLAALKMTNTWVKLDAAFRLLGQDAQADELLARLPQAAAAIGDEAFKSENWERAFTHFSKSITPETKDADLFAKRARAGEKLQRWAETTADWQRAWELRPSDVRHLGEWAAVHERLGQFEQAAAVYSRLIDHRRDGAASPDDLAQAFRLRGAHHVRAGQWKLAASDYAESVTGHPNSISSDWMMAAALWAYAADAEQHRMYCQNMAARFRDSKVASDAERTVKVSLLLGPGVVADQATVAKFLDSMAKTEDQNLRKWFLSAKALLACRTEELPAAQQSVEEAIELMKASREAPSSTAGLMARSVQALIFARQGDEAKAQVALDELKSLLATGPKLQWRDDGTLDGSTLLNGERVQHDRLIPEILRRETAKLIGRNTDSQR